MRIAVTGLSDRDAEDTYNFIASSYPGACAVQPVPGHAIEGVLAEFVGTKAVRLGRQPTPESIEAMRAAIAACVSVDAPIPVLIPSAAVKVPPGAAQLDLAELSAIRQLVTLQGRVVQHYGPGLRFRIRMEDAVEVLISEGVPGLRCAVDGYGRSLQALSRLLGAGKFVEVVRETDYAPEITILSAAKQAANYFLAYLYDSHDLGDEEHPQLHSYRLLQREGWTGGVSHELRSFFRERFRRNYPDRPDEQHYPMVARYLGSIVARRRCGAVGIDPAWPAHLELSWVPAIPGTEPTSCRVYYRTAPRVVTTDHLAPWVARAVVRRPGAGGQPRIALTNWWAHPQVVDGMAVIEHGRDSVTLPTPHMREAA